MVHRVRSRKAFVRVRGAGRMGFPVMVTCGRRGDGDGRSLLGGDRRELRAALGAGGGGEAGAWVTAFGAGDVAEAALCADALEIEGDGEEECDEEGEHEEIVEDTEPEDAGLGGAAVGVVGERVGCHQGRVLSTKGLEDGGSSVEVQ